MAQRFFEREDLAVLGTLAAEDRCRAVPELLLRSRNGLGWLLEIRDPPQAFPDYSEQVKEKIDRNRDQLDEVGCRFESTETRLLAEEDDLLDLLDDARRLFDRKDTIVVDITCMPKRYFCFILKRLVLAERYLNVVVTYAQAGLNGYTAEHLAEDPMTCDHLPGFAAPLPPRGDTLVIAVGFEVLSLRSLLEIYRDRTKDTRIILSFPADVVTIRREWKTLADMAAEDAAEINTQKVEAIATWDADAVYRTLAGWNEGCEGLTLAPFGPKPHTLGMALFAMKHDCGLYYTQPKAYHPDYSRGIGTTWAYVVKWNGVACFDRRTLLV